LRSLLDLLENARYFWYAYFNFHGCFSFFIKVWVKTLLKEKRPFFYTLRIYTKYYTIPETGLFFLTPRRPYIIKFSLKRKYLSKLMFIPELLKKSST
ncbi:MAG: hypothetical protein KKB35_13090, partial [Proteobacteria bacterium]|nr:hypothetical protein [Pseudomonadota bacterium]